MLAAVALLPPVALATFGCGGHGDCLAGVCVDGSCLCREGYDGERCEFRSCAWMEAYRPCLNDGQCVPSPIFSITYVV